jgi:photosystem II stability/assembly factor-like uncharacterized protein
MGKSLLVIIPVFTFLAFSPMTCHKSDEDGGLYKSADMGESWEQLTSQSEENSITHLDILSMVVDPNDSEILYLGTGANGIHRSCSRGEHWYKLEDKNRILDSRANVHDIAIDPKDPKRIYIGTYQNKKGRVFRSQDAGQSWEEVYLVSKEGYAVFAVAVDIYDPSIVYAGTAQGGFLKSVDYGKSWQIMKWFDDVISDIVINPQDTRQIYVSTFKKGVYKTSNKGLTWQSFEESLKDFRQSEKVEKLVIDPRNPSIIYSGSEYGLLRSENGGQTWNEIKIIMPSKSMPILSLAVNPQNPEHLYYGSGSVLYRSLDRGLNWTVYDFSSDKNIKTIVVDPRNSNLVYVGMHE